MKRALFLLSTTCLLLLLWQVWPDLVNGPSDIPIPDPPQLHDRIDPAIEIARATDIESEDIGQDLARVRERTPQAADTPTAALRVLVLRADGRPVADATVVVAPPLVVDSRTDERAEPTDEHGTAEFVLPPGPWRCRTVLGASLDLDLAAGEQRSIELELPAEPVVRGVVTDERGQRIANASVLVLGLSALGVARMGARTGADGVFELPGIGAGRQLAAAHKDFAPSAPQRIELADNEAETITLVLRRPHGVLVGTVTDVSGVPLSEALVWFGQSAKSAIPVPAPAPAQVQRTERDGTFTSPTLPLGEIEVRALAPGFALSRTTATVTDGTPLPLRIVLDTGARVTGFVRRPDGSPATDAIVFSGVRRSIGSRLVRTGIDGSFALESLPTHDTELTALALADDGVTPLQASTHFQIPAGTAREWNPLLAPQPRGSVRGHLEDQNGVPLAGWLVLATPSGHRRGLGTESGKDGNFALLGLPTGQTVDVSVRRPAAGWNSFPDAESTGIVVDGPAITIAVMNPARDRSSLLGTVVDEAGSPLAATVHLLHQRGDVAHYSTRLDGSFRIDTIPAGTVHVEIRQASYPPLRLPPLQLAMQDVRDLGTLKLQRGGLAFGRVFGPEDQALTNVTMRLIDDGDREIATAECTDTGFRTPLLPPGRYDLLVQADDVAPSRVALHIRAGEEREVDVRLEPGSLHRLRVHTDAEEDRSAKVSVVVFDEEQRAVWVAHLPMTQGEAEFRAYLRNGRFAVLALGVRGYRATGSFAVDAQSTLGPSLTVLELKRGN
ncbi:MAG: carboxypeptidase regulatory-like domain-containing protein [Planctomycetota bacterium]